MHRICMMFVRVVIVSVALLAGSPGWSQGGIIVFEDAEVIQGEIEKPEAYYILRPSNLDYEAVASEDSFLERLYESVEEPTF